MIWFWLPLLGLCGYAAIRVVVLTVEIRRLDRVIRAIDRFIKEDRETVRVAEEKYEQELQKQIERLSKAGGS